MRHIETHRTDGSLIGFTVEGEDALCQHIAGLSEACSGPGCPQTQPSRTLEQAPGGIVWIMIPLPLHTERVGAEVVVRGHSGTRHNDSGVGLVVCGVRNALVAYYGPILLPLYRLEIWHTSETAEIFLHDGPPLARWGVKECALVNGVWLVVNDFLHEHLFLIGAEDVLGAEYSLTAGPASIGSIYIIVFADLVEVAAFQSVLVANHVLLLDEVEVSIKLAHLDVADAAGYIHLTIIEEHSRVVVDA